MKCKQCSAEFTESEAEQKLREKLAPEINGKKFELPEPEMCPLCREQNRIAFRNERKLYKRPCALCKKEVLSIYSPDKDYQATCGKCFWSDKWDPVDVGIEYDASKSFFVQFDELLHKSKLLGLFAVNVENSDFVNQEEDVKDCYLTVGGHYNESCYYTTYGVEGFKNIDSYFVFKSQYLYECLFCFDCNNSKYLESCENCNDCFLCESCVGCNDCIGCVNLHRKQYYYFNEKLTKEEYEKKVAEIFATRKSLEKEKDKFAEFSMHQPKKFARMTNVENSTGDYLTNCKNIHEGYSVEDSENGINHYLTAYIKYAMELSSVAWAEFTYGAIGSTRLNNCISISQCVSCPDSYYCSNCQNSKNLFGCVGLVHKQYCILNKQFTKEEYFKKVAQIIKNMQEAGEWGRFFPISISPFGYNETVAMEYFPLTTEEAKKNGWKWQDKDYGIKYDGPFYDPKEISAYDPKQNPYVQKEIDKCLKGILKCEISGKPFKIISQELAEYVQNNIQIPRRHPDQRHLDRLARINPMKLYHRSCMNEGPSLGALGKCQNEFETTYAPDRSEKVYCEPCYQKSII
ncbi:MAG: hypothetical protein ABH810_03490 [bacterium]